MARKRRRKWQGSRIKSLPHVEAEVRDRRGRVVRRKSVEEMLRELKRRLKKSGVMEKVREKMYYEKPSDRRRRERARIRYMIQKQQRRRERGG